MKQTKFIVEIGDPHIDQAWCTCGDKEKSTLRWELTVWAYRHIADHIEAANSER